MKEYSTGMMGALRGRVRRVAGDTARGWARDTLPGARSQEPGARSQEPGARSQEPGARSQDYTILQPVCAMSWLTRPGERRAGPPETSASSARSARGGRVSVAPWAGVLALALLLLLPFTPSAQAVVLVSNLTEEATTANGSNLNQTRALAQAFTTGTHGSGYSLTSIDLWFGNSISAAHIDDVTVSVHTVSLENPDTEVAELTNPTSIPGISDPPMLLTTHRSTFTALPGTILAASTSYIVVLEFDQNTNIGVYKTTFDDQTGATGWSIANVGRKRESSTWSAELNDASWIIRVNGEESTGPTVTSVAVTSTPTAASDTYGVGEAIEFTVTFSDLVEVSTGRPHFEFAMGNSGASTEDKQATYQRGSGTAALVFAYTVLAADMDDNGIWIGAQDRTIKLDTGEFIRAVDDEVDAVLTHGELSTQGTHKVDGSLTPPAPPTPPTTCDVLWCATLTAGVSSILSQGITLTVAGFTSINDPDVGSISPVSFQHGGGTYTSDTLVLSLVTSSTNEVISYDLSLSFTSALPMALADAVLSLGSEDFALADATYSAVDFGYVWSDPARDLWNDGDTVEVSLALAPATAPEPPTALEAAPYGDDAVLLSWTAPATGTTPTGYKVEVSTDAGANWTDAEDDTQSTDTSYIHGGLSASVTRHYRVSALASGTASTPSATDSATTCASGVPWCPTLTAGTATAFGLAFSGFNSEATPPYGSLSPASFRLGGSTYISEGFYHQAAGGSDPSAFVLSFESALPAALARFTLRSGVEELSRADSNDNVREFTWTDPPIGPWTDGQEVAFELAAAATANNAATGAPAITGTATVGQTLTAGQGNIADVDGLPAGTFPDDYSFQWVRVDSDGTNNPTDIGTDSRTYDLVAADAGKKIKVEVSFTDDESNAEELTSDAYPSGTTTVAALPPPLDLPPGGGEVQADWSLIPSGLGAGDDFRLLIVTSTRQTAADTAIADYNTVVQGDVFGTGHTAIRAYAAGFRMLGCTETTSAITNTDTASTDAAAAIYYLNGAKVADDYADLYDGTWDSHGPKYPSGTSAPTSGLSSQTLVGCTSAGESHADNYLGASQVTQGYPGSPGSEFGVFPVNVSSSQRFYGLSGIFRVAAAPPETIFFTEGATTTRRIAENTAANVNIGAPVSAMQSVPDETGLMYTLAGTDMDSFTIDDGTGQLGTKAGVSYDFETQDTYAVTVSAEDSAGRSVTIEVTINVTNVMTEQPMAPAAPLVEPAAGSDTSLDVSWTAPDRNGGPEITGYAVEFREGDNGTWTDHPHSGTDTSTTITGRSSGTEHQVQVRALNGERPSAWSAFGSGRTSGTAETPLPPETPSSAPTETPIVTDPANRAPAFADALAVRRVAENTAANTPIGEAVTATDEDGDPLTYSLGGPGAVAFTIDPATGQLTTQAALDFEAQATYTLMVTAADPRGGTATVTVTLHVTDVDTASAPPEAPTVGPTDGSTTSLDVNWTEPDPNGGPELIGYEVQYRQGTSGTWRDHSFSGTGTSTTITNLTAGTDYQVQVRAQNGEAASDWSPPGAGRTTANHAPVFADSMLTLTLRVVENAAADTKVGAPVTATDADDDALTYSLGGRAGSAFAIDAVTGQITTKAGVPYDFERTPVYAVTVTASDGMDSATIAVTIELENVLAVSITPAQARVLLEEGAVRFVVSSDTPPAGELTVGYTVSQAQDWFAPAQLTGRIRYDAQAAAWSGVSLAFLPSASELNGKVTVTLAPGAGYELGTATATVIIGNTDLLVQAWLGRFGRTVGTHVTDAVGDRLRVTPAAGSHVTIGGYRLPLGQRGGEARGASHRQSAGRAGAAEHRPGSAGMVVGRPAGAVAPSRPAPGQAVEPRAGEARPADAGPSLLEGLAQVLGVGPGGSAPAGDGTGSGAGVDPRLGQTRTLNLNFDLRQVLLGSSFRLALNGDGAGAGTPRLTAWGRVAGTQFAGRDGALTLDGDVLTGTLGVDGTWDRSLVGLAVAHSRGDGGYRSRANSGDVANTLTSLHPYLRYAVTDRLDVWGMLGYGWGTLTLEPGAGVKLETDTNLMMGAFGGRGLLLAADETGGYELATRTDAMLTRTTSDEVTGLESLDADAHRLRLVLEGSRGFTWEEGRRFTPTVELGLRHDWGHAETGFGLELGGRVHYADPTLGLTVEATVRGLLAHEDSDYQEWGASGTVRINPNAMGRGLSLTLSPTWGAAASGVDGLWSRQTTAGLAPPSPTQASTGQLAAELGYGLPTPVGTGLLTPYAGTVLTDGAARTYRLGTRLQLTGGSATGLTLSLEGTRQEPAGQQPANQGLRLQVTWGF